MNGRRWPIAGIAMNRARVGARNLSHPQQPRATMRDDSLFGIVNHFDSFGFNLLSYSRQLFVFGQRRKHLRWLY